MLQAEILAKKYEEKYKQVAEIASKLTIEEAKFREIQVMVFFFLLGNNLELVFDYLRYYGIPENCCIGFIEVLSY